MAAKANAAAANNITVLMADSIDASRKRQHEDGGIVRVRP
jgi:hypothetical protein